MKQTMAYAREQQNNNPLFNAFVQVGASGVPREAGGPYTTRSSLVSSWVQG